jgi:hypothetical protein
MSSILLHTHALPKKANARPRGVEPPVSSTISAGDSRLCGATDADLFIRAAVPHRVARGAAVDRDAEVRLQRVVADAQHTSRFALVAVPPLEDEARVSSGPCPQTFVTLERRAKRRQVFAAHQRRKILELDDVAGSKGDDPLDEAFELANVAWPVVGDERVQALPD